MTPAQVAETVAMLRPTHSEPKVFTIPKRKRYDKPISVKKKLKLAREQLGVARARLRMVYEQLATRALVLHSKGYNEQAHEASKCADIAEGFQLEEWREDEPEETDA